MLKVILSGLFSYLFFSFVFSSSLHARVDKSTEYCSSGSSNIECRKIETRTNYKNNGSGDWLKSSDAYQFRSKNGKSCKMKGSLRNKNNVKLVYSSAYVNKRGDWSKPGLLVEQRKEGAWRYNINWKFSCKSY